MFEVTVEETFAAGHALRGYRGKCENVHGHNYRVQLTLEGPELDAVGLLVDFVEVKRLIHGDVAQEATVLLNACSQTQGRTGVPKPFHKAAVFRYQWRELESQRNPAAVKVRKQFLQLIVRHRFEELRVDLKNLNVRGGRTPRR